MTILVVTGVGTEIGKTHLSEALLVAARELGSTFGYKPVETGVRRGEEGADARKLRLASTFHVKHAPRCFTYEAAISPHLAARAIGTPVAPDVIAAEVVRLSGLVDILLVELAGGLFSPLGERETNADLLRALNAPAVVVAPDRLGVLHDLTALRLAADHRGLPLRDVLLSAPATPDTSTGLNAAEIQLTGMTLRASLPRAPTRALARDPALRAYLRSVVGRPGGLPVRD